jgi:hypothetical protein
VMSLLPLIHRQVTSQVTGQATDPERTSMGPGESPVSDLLEDPDAVRRAVFTVVRDAVLEWWPIVTPAAVCAALAVFAGRQWLRRRRLGRLWHDARLITITPPPEVEAAGGPALWGNLVGLLRPAVRRALAGQPHLTFEYHWDHATARIQMWVPGLVPPGLVERAIEAAWPGTHTTTRPAHPADSADPTAGPAGPGPGEAGAATGGTLRLARNEVLPLATGHDADPLRALFGAASGLAVGEHACVQILARPLAGRRIRQARRALRRLRTGKPTRPSAIVLDFITGLITPSRNATGTPRAGRGGWTSPDPERAAELRAALGKTAEPAWEAVVRYAVISTPPNTAQTITSLTTRSELTGPQTTSARRRAHRRAHRAARDQARGRAHALASAFALYTGRNFLTRRRLRHPTSIIAARRLDRGDLLGVSELAALAHLPLDPATPGLSRAGARAVAPPPGVPSPPDEYGRPRPTSPVPSSPVPTSPAALAVTSSPAVSAPREQAAQPSSDPGSAARGGPPDDQSSEPAAPIASPTEREALRAGAVKVLGDTDIGAQRPVGVSVADARHHVHVIGATGSGKSTLMINMILGDVAARRGVLVIDPKGDLVLDLLDRLPAAAASRVVLIDPDDPGAPPCLNPLDLTISNGHTTSGHTTSGHGPSGRTPAAEVDVVVDNVVGIFRRIFAGFWGPRSDDLFRGACLTLLRHHQNSNHELGGSRRGGSGIGGSGTDGSGVDGFGFGGFPLGVPTLADIPRLLDDDAFRRVLTAGIRDEVLAGFWRWFEQLPVGQRANAVGPVLNKLRAFLLRSFVQESVAAGRATLDMTRVLDGGICLVRLPKGVLGEETSHLLGSFVVARAWQAASARARAGTPRIDAGLYIDECHNFLNLPYPIEDMLAEARGYRLSMILAHQHLAQLPKDLREGISANARNKVFFNASPDDARELEQHTLPTLARHDLSHLGAFQAATRLLTGSEQSAAFTMRTRPLPPAIPGRAEQIRRATRSHTPPSHATGSHTLGSHAPSSRATDPTNPTGNRARGSLRPRRPDVRTQFLHPTHDTANTDATEAADVGEKG